MKIVRVCNHIEPCIGGVERVVLDTSRKLAQRGHEVKVICLDRCANSAEILPAKGGIEGIGVERIPFLDLKYYKIAPAVLWKIQDADVVHVHGTGFFSDYLLLTKIFHGKGVVVTTHGGIFHTREIGAIKAFYFNVVQRILLHFAYAVVADSRNDQRLFSRICKKTLLVENGVDISKFRPGRKKPGTFLFVGRFAKNKRVEKLLEAFAGAWPKNFELIIAGTDWENLLEGYKMKISDLKIGKNVKFVLNPSEDELKALYSGAKYFVSASQYEGFGLTVIEAMASGCIPIVQNNEGFGNLVEDGINGFLMEFGDSKRASAQLKAIVIAHGNNWKKLSLGAIKRAESFSWEGKIEMLEKIYKGAMG